MTKFKFPLEAALRLRTMRVDSEKTKLQDLIAHRNRLQISLDSTRRERQDATAFVQSAAEPLTGDLRALSLFNIGLQARIQTLTEALARLDRSIAEQKQHLLKAERDERCIGKLRVKRLAEWNLQAEREIEATAQELWLFSHTTCKDD